MVVEKLYAAFRDCSGVCIDTRKIQEGDLFIALKGPNFNANDFALKAITEGCRYAIVDEDREEFRDNPRVLLVKDSLEALQDLALYHRRKLRIPVIALTGSNGKTTTKELMRATLSQQYNCYCTFGNLNNHIGVPLSLLSITKKHEIAVIEMGANHQNEIKALCEIAEPDYGLITNIGLAHLEGFGGEEGVFKGKKELFDHLIARKRTLFVNCDDEQVTRAAGSALKEAITYGSSAETIYSGTITPAKGFLKFDWWRSDAPSSKQTIQTQVSGEYNFSNALAAVAVARYFGVSAAKIKRGLEAYVPSNQRSQVEETERGNTVIIDCYNANPSSMKAAIDNLKSMPHTQKAVILGDMLELGESSQTAHQEVLEWVEGVNTVMLVGPEFSSLQSPNGYMHFETTEDAAKAISSKQLAGALILLKGSRKMKLEALLEFL